MSGVVGGVIMEQLVRVRSVVLVLQTRCRSVCALFKFHSWMLIGVCAASKQAVPCWREGSCDGSVSGHEKISHMARPLSHTLEPAHCDPFIEGQNDRSEIAFLRIKIESKINRKRHGVTSDIIYHIVCNDIIILDVRPV